MASLVALLGRLARLGLRQAVRVLMLELVLLWGRFDPAGSYYAIFV